MADAANQTRLKRRRRLRRTVHFGEPLPPGAHTFRASWLCGPAVAWVTVFLLVPLLLVVGLSFTPRGDAGEMVWRFSLDNYARLFGHLTNAEVSTPTHIFGRSVGVAALTAALCLFAALPVAFFIAGLPRRWQSVAATLVILPFWTNLLIRTYGWQLVLAPDGWLADVLITACWLDPNDTLYPGWPAVMVAMVGNYFPFMLLPLYACVVKLDRSLIEAAADLGATPTQVFFRATLPQLRAGLIAGSVLVFVPVTAQFLVPDLLGRGQVVLFGNAVEQHVIAQRDWPFGCAVAVVALLVMLAGLALHTRVTPGRREVALP